MGLQNQGAARKFPRCHIQETKFVIMNNSSIEKNDVISTDEDLEKLPEVNPKMFHFIKSQIFLRHGIT